MAVTVRKKMPLELRLIRRLIVWSVVSVSIAIAAAPRPADAQASGKATKIRIAERVGDLAYAPVHLADTLGFFRQAGIDAQFIQFDTGGMATKAVVSGGADICETTYGGMVLGDVQGAGLVQTVLLSSVPGLVLLVDKANDKADVKSLAGATIGVSGLGTPPEFFVRDLFAANGLSPSDMKFAATGNGVPAVTALTMKRVQAAVQFDPLVTRMVADGQARILVDTRTLKGTEAAFGGPYVGGNLAATQDYVQANTATVKAVNRAIVRTLRWMQQHSASEIADALPAQIYYPAATQKLLLIASLEASKDFYSGDGTISAAAAANVVRNLKIANPKLDFDHIAIASTYGNSLIKDEMSHE